MKEQSKIPTSKVQRATRFIKTGAKVGSNYIKHYSKRAFNPQLTREALDHENAADIYESLSTLKGSALKVAQMMSMDKNIMPKAYTDKFAMAQYSAPPLSFPLVVKTFQQYLGKSPYELFDSFTKNAVNAASIGQVHQASLNGKKLAVKVQYPGVADSVSSDLKLVKPFALQLLSLSEKDVDQYMEEVESRLLEETDYELELKRGLEISAACNTMDNLHFPTYYPELSGKKILTMDWLDGQHLKDFIDTNPAREVRDKVGQAIWDFYHYQIHVLKMVHADPHPGNFIIDANGNVGILDFGCVKVIPEEFYVPYFKLLSKEIIDQEEDLLQAFQQLHFINDQDTPGEKAYFIHLFKEMIRLLSRPFHYENFDFSDDAYFSEIYEMGDRLGRSKELRNSKMARGSPHGLYINRTYFGIYNILNQLGAKVKIKTSDWLVVETI